LVGLTLSPKSDIHEHQPAIGNKPPTVSDGAQGEVDVDGCNTGLSVNSQGDLSGYLALVPGVHNVTAIGPFVIQGGSTFDPTKLSVGNFVFNVSVNPDGFSSIPSALSVNLPINGGTLKSGHFVNVTYPTPDFARGTGVLRLDWPGITIEKSQLIVNGKVSFRALKNNARVPLGGVSTVTYSYVP